MSLMGRDAFARNAICYKIELTIKIWHLTLRTGFDPLQIRKENIIRLCFEKR